MIKVLYLQIPQFSFVNYSKLLMVWIGGLGFLVEGKWETAKTLNRWALQMLLVTHLNNDPLTGVPLDISTCLPSLGFRLAPKWEASLPFGVGVPFL